jgi:photosystem II stability/assembly factor-like uncharacterized protein
MKKLFYCLLLVFIFTNKSYSQFEWKNTGGPFGSGASFLYSNDVFAFVPEHDFLYRSADGVQWEKLDHKVSAKMAVHQDTIVSTLRNDASGPLRFQISFDNGDHWVEKNIPAQLNGNEDVEMSVQGIFFADGSGEKIYVSKDLGDSWDSISTPVKYNEMKMFDDRIFIWGDSLVWRSDEVVENWFNITPPVRSYRAVDDLVSTGTGIMVSADEDLFISHDDGLSWSSMYGLLAPGNDKLTLVGNDVYINFFGVLGRTSDFGIHWDTLVTNFYPRPIHYIGLRDILLLTTYDRGILRWDESADKVVESNDGITKAVIYDLSYGSDKIWAACGNGLFAYDIPTSTWSTKMKLPLTKIETSFVSANEKGWVIYGEYYTNKFYLTEDQGTTWDTIHTEFEITDMQLVDEYFFMFAGRFLRSIDKGISWDTLGFTVLSIEMTSFRDKMYVTCPGGLQYTEDKGLTWNSISTPVKLFRVYSFGDKLYAIDSDQTGYTYFYTSLDAIHWKRATSGVPNIDGYTFWYHFHPLFFRDAQYDYAFLGDIGHFISADGGITWSALETTQTGRDYLIHNDIIYLGGEGMYSTPIEDPFLTAIEGPDAFSNTLNYSISPNPVKDFMNITINGDEVFREIQFSLFDSTGSLLKSQVENSPYNIQMDVRKIPSGIYFLQANSGNQHGMIKVIKN